MRKRKYYVFGRTDYDKHLHFARTLATRNSLDEALEFVKTVSCNAVIIRETLTDKEGKPIPLADRKFRLINPEEQKEKKQ